MRRPTRAAIATTSRGAAEAGAHIAKHGGNAVDIAVAAALTATASEILMCSIAGSGFLMVHRAGAATELIEGADAMPGRGAPRDPGPPRWRTVHVPYGDGIDFMVGHGSVAVPGFLAALELAWQRHGSLPWAEIVAPSVELARAGWPTAQGTADWLALAGKPLFGHQQASFDSFFPGGEPVRTGQIMRIPGLADTMDAIAREGARALYQGDLAAALVAELQAHGGYVTREDLAAYRATARRPLALESRGFELALNPPPAVGGAAAGTLIGLIQHGWRGDMSPRERALHHARAQRYLLDLRDRELARRSFDDAAARLLLAEDALLRHAHALRSPHTTHMSVATADGSAVAVTMSLGYGSGVTIPGTGIACNNSLGEPELNPFGFFAVEPGTPMISNMAPTVAWHPDGRCIALGSPGAGRITTTVAQTWTRHALEGMSLEDAVLAPRLHVEARPDGHRVHCEPGIDTSLLHAEHMVRPYERLHMFFGGAHLAAVDADGRLHAVADPRRSGTALLV